MRFKPLLIVVMVFSACSLFENEQDIPELPMAFIGEWEWVRTHQGWGPGDEADSVDYIMMLSIPSDNEAIFTRDGIIMSRYKIETVKREGEYRFVLKSVYERNPTHCKNFYLGFNQIEELMMGSADCYDSPAYWFRKSE